MVERKQKKIKPEIPTTEDIIELLGETEFYRRQEVALINVEMYRQSRTKRYKNFTDCILEKNQEMAKEILDGLWEEKDAMDNMINMVFEIGAAMVLDAGIKTRIK